MRPRQDCQLAVEPLGLSPSIDAERRRTGQIGHDVRAAQAFHTDITALAQRVAATPALGRESLGNPFMASAFGALANDGMGRGRHAASALDALVMLAGSVLDHPFMATAFRTVADCRV